MQRDTIFLTEWQHLKLIYPMLGNEDWKCIKTENKLGQFIHNKELPQNFFLAFITFIATKH